MSHDAAMRQAAQFFGSGRLDEAARACEEILRDDAGHFYALHLSSAIALRRAQFDACIAFATRALDVAPGHPEVLANRGAAYRRSNRIDQALADYDTALGAGAATPALLVNRGIALAALNRHEEAIAQYDRAIALDARHAPAHFHRGLSRLVLGELAGGFADNEWRWGGSDTQGPARALDGRPWTGAEDIRGSTVLLYAEQGLGDTIQFARYATLLKERGARVILEIPPPLVQLLSGLADEVVEIGAALPRFDFHLAMLSAPFAFGTTLDDIPAAARYLQAHAQALAKWQMREHAAPSPRIGFAWSGSRTLANDLNRSMPLATMLPLVERAGTAFSLQKDVRDSDAGTLAASRLVPASNALRDFADTAGLIEQLDLVITVDTAVAHLAGALGKPVWVLLPFSPDWRWLLDRSDSPWYPSARLFRQQRLGDWQPVIAGAGAALADLA